MEENEILEEYMMILHRIANKFDEFTNVEELEDIIGEMEMVLIDAESDKELSDEDFEELSELADGLVAELYNDLLNLKKKNIGESKKVFKLSESKFVELIKTAIDEQFGMGPWAGKGPGPGQKKIQKFVTLVNMDGSLFENGIAEIDLNSDAFKKGLDALKSVAKQNKNAEIKVEGGASAVGKGKFDNEGLARRRANNFINAVKNQVPNLKFTVTTKVGVAEKKNSPEAKAEQYVKLSIPSDQIRSYVTQAIDKTAVTMKPPIFDPTKPQKGNMITKCFVFPKNKENEVMKFFQGLGASLKA